MLELLSPPPQEERIAIALSAIPRCLKLAILSYPPKIPVAVNRATITSVLRILSSNVRDRAHSSCDMSR